MTYRVLVLPDSDRMRPELLAYIVDLVHDGANVWAPKRILASPSLVERSSADERVGALAEKMWSVRRINAADKPMAIPGVARDFEARESATGQSHLEWLHRRSGTTDFYFVSNQEAKSCTAAVMFRAKGVAEIWRNDDGRIERPKVRVIWATRTASCSTWSRWNPSSSSFATSRPSRAPPLIKPTGAMDLAGPWTVASRPAGARRVDRDAQADPAQRARRQRGQTFRWNGDLRDQVRRAAGPVGRWRKATTLELGDVQVMAEVKLNGKDLGLLWKPPYSIDVSDAVRAGSNDLEIRVTTLWVNRLIGDEAYPPLAKPAPTTRFTGGIAEIPAWLAGAEPKPQTQRKTFATWRHYKPDAPLVPSGLIGPVKIWFGDVIERGVR
jgi:hypothetical protein